MVISGFFWQNGQVFVHFIPLAIVAMRPSHHSKQSSHTLAQIISGSLINELSEVRYTRSLTSNHQSQRSSVEVLVLRLCEEPPKPREQMPHPSRYTRYEPEHKLHMSCQKNKRWTQIERKTQTVR